MTALERITGRSAPIYALSGPAICPNPTCRMDLSPMEDYDEVDPWTCWACGERLDYWWEFEDLYWYDADDDEFLWLANQIKLAEWLDESFPTEVSYNSCICHNIVNCPDKGRFYDSDKPYSITGAYIKTYLTNSGWEVIGDIYAYDDVMHADCRTCQRYSRWDCMPLRSWIRKDTVLGCTRADMIIPCKHHELDEQWCKAMNMDLDVIQKIIKQTVKGRQSEVY